ncbi:MAG: glycosyltransferase family 2 protein, partial [Chloroflexi bacterium]|nr:glycosyltransferase family 2 protein [Chloroflexota bacterium]
IPAFNEAQAIKLVLESLRTPGFDFVQEIIVIDDGSSDNTACIAQEVGERVIRHQQNMGYGASLKTGIRAAQTEFVLTMDADDQHHAEDVQRLWDMAGDYDMVVGQRTGLRQSPFWRMPGKWLLWIMANYLTRRSIPDLNSGLRLIRRDIALKYLHVCPSGFSFSTTITITLLNRGYKVAYIPIEIKKRVGKSTVVLSTGLDTLILILRLASLFDPLRVFIPISLIIGAIGILWGIPYTLLGRGVSIGAMLAIVTAILLFGLGLLCDQISQLRLERFE